MLFVENIYLYVHLHQCVVWSLHAKAKIVISRCSSSALASPISNSMVLRVKPRPEPRPDAYGHPRMTRLKLISLERSRPMFRIWYSGCDFSGDQVLIKGWLHFFGGGVQGFEVECFGG